MLAHPDIQRALVGCCILLYGIGSIAAEGQLAHVGPIFCRMYCCVDGFVAMKFRSHSHDSRDVFDE